MTCKVHLVADGKGRPLGWVLTGGNVNDTTMMTTVLEHIRVPRTAAGRPRTRPDRVLADKGYPSKSNRAWLRQRGIAATIPERDDQIAHRRKKPGRPIDFGDDQKTRYRGRNVVERCFNKLKQWRGIAMRSDKTARSYRAAISLAATLIWIKTNLINAAKGRSGLLVVPGGRGPRRLAAYFVLTGTVSLLQPGHIQVAGDLLLDLLSDDDVDRLTEAMTRVRDRIRAEPPRRR